MLKKSLLVSALLTAMCGSAMATEIDIYGRVDAGLRFTHVNGGDETTEMTSNRSTSRVGFNIVEPITDTLKAKAYLETGFSSDTGAIKGEFFARRSIVALAGDFGEIGMGRLGAVQSSASPYSMGIIKFDPFGTSYGHASVASTFANSDRGDNSIAYISPSYNGFKFGATYSFGDEDTEDEDVGNRDNRTLSLAGTYTSDTLFVTLAFGQKSFANNGDVSYKDARVYSLGGTYKIGPAKLFAGAAYQTNWRTAAKITTDTASGFDGYSALLGAQYAIGAGKIITSLQYFDGELSDNSQADVQRKIAAAAYEYKLSKMTTAYVAATYSNVDGDAAGVQSDSGKELNATTLFVGIDKHF